MSKVSIIIPCFNAIDYIDKTLDCCFNQTYSNIEIVVVDDGSTDGTLEYLLKIEHPNLIISKNPKKGACAARNYGLELSSGAYIQFLDADDLLSLDKIGVQVASLDINEDQIAVCSTKHFYDTPENGIVTDQDFLFSTKDCAQFLLNLWGGNGKEHNMVGQHAWLVPRKIIDLVGGWNEKLTKDQDGEFFTRVLLKCNGIVYTDEVYAYYRKHVGGSNIANQVQRKHLESQRMALDLKLKYLESEKHTDTYKNAFALQYKFFAINAYPEYKDLSEEAMRISQKLGGSNYLPVLGGNIIEFIKFTMGWKLAKCFKKNMHKVSLFLQLKKGK